LKNKQKANQKANAAEKDEYLNRKYASNNARVNRRATFKAEKKTAVRDHYLYIKSISDDKFSPEGGAQPTLSTRLPATAAATSLDERIHHVNSISSRQKKHVTFQQEEDNLLIDFGANGNFIHRENIMDLNSISKVTESQVFLPDESGVSAHGVGSFCGQLAHLLPNFDKSLLCSEFFTDQKCAVLVLDDRLYCLKLNSTVLQQLSDVVKESQLNGQLLLNILRENGLYATSEKAIRKAFNKSKKSLNTNKTYMQSNASYFTAKLSDVEELVRFWHVNLGHASKSNMITIIENNLIDGLGDEVTVAQVAKHFPDCADCGHGNMAQKRHPKSSDPV
jgi:hypothetical protein